MGLYRTASPLALLDSNQPCFTVADDLLDFNFDAASTSSIPAAKIFRREAHACSLPEYEEELEWLSNKDAFPTVDTYFGILADNPDLISSHQSPISVLENSSDSNSSITPVASYCSALKVPDNFPIHSRNKRSRRKRLGSVGLHRQQCLWLNTTSLMKTKPPPPPSPSIIVPTFATPRIAAMGRRCLHCQTDKTPQWRAGPMGPKTLCNACGVRYKSGRLLPEYRPASSPTFSSVLHSNSHRKVVEMRRKKQMVETAVSERSG